MATLVFTAIGSALGGPLGGAVGGFLGQQVDAALFGSSRQGPRLNDLKVTTSSYGSAIARHYGTIRAPGTIIWATDLVEHADQQGGKGSPSITLYTYSISFAVALASRPIHSVGRIWADGNLLRGAAGDLKTGGALRIYTGHGDHDADPLIASAEGSLAPAFRQTAYVVFEDLDLSTFGNRIPALTFEIIADEGALDLAPIISGIETTVEADVALPGLSGFSYEGGPVISTLSTIDSIYPLTINASGRSLKIVGANATPSSPPQLAEPAISADQENFGSADGQHVKRQAGALDVPTGLRYYDLARDYLAGLQRADGRARPGRERTIDFPGALASVDARALANAAAERANWAKETLAWRTAELGPGSVVTVPGKAGLWRITSWEWRENGTEMQLLRLPFGPARHPDADAGSARTSADLVATPTLLQAFELPWDGTGTADEPRIYAAASSSSAGWMGAVLFQQQASALVPVGSAGRRRAVVGNLITGLAASPAVLLERQAYLDVQLASTDFALLNASPEALANGSNRVRVGAEVLQFALATPLGTGQWRLAGLLRGRGGTEAAASAGHTAGSPFVLLDPALTLLDPAKVSASTTQIAANGLGDPAPVFASIANKGLTLRPLAPVHPHADINGGSLSLSWVRRARGVMTWSDEVDVPLVEDTESYLVGIGPTDGPSASWTLSAPSLTIDASAYSALAANHAGKAVWVRQIGRHAMSDPLLLFTFP